MGAEALVREGVVVVRVGVGVGGGVDVGSTFTAPAFGCLFVPFFFLLPLRPLPPATQQYVPPLYLRFLAPVLVLRHAALLGLVRGAAFEEAPEAPEAPGEDGGDVDEGWCSFLHHCCLFASVSAL